MSTVTQRQVIIGKEKNKTIAEYLRRSRARKLNKSVSSGVSAHWASASFLEKIRTAKLIKDHQKVVYTQIHHFRYICIQTHASHAVKSCL